VVRAACIGAGIVTRHGESGDREQARHFKMQAVGEGARWYRPRIPLAAPRHAPPGFVDDAGNDLQAGDEVTRIRAGLRLA
jgi:hypothetical protein